MACDDYYDLNREEKHEASRANVVAAKALGFDDLSPLGFYGTDTGEHVAVCSRCSALVHYPLPVSDGWPPTPKWVKDTDSLRKHLASAHGVEEATDDRMHRADPAQR